MARRKRSRKFDRQLRKFEQDLGAFLSRQVIHRHLMDHHGQTVIRAVIGSAKAGIGPGDKQYPEYAESYKKQLDMSVRGRGTKRRLWSRKLAAASLAGSSGKRRIHKAISAGAKLWLVLAGEMLDKTCFEFELYTGDKLFLEWTHEDDDVRTYAAVHQGTAHGGEDHTRGDVPPRPFLHFENKLNATAATQAYERTLDELTAQFNAGRRPA